MEVQRKKWNIAPLFQNDLDGAAYLRADPETCISLWSHFHRLHELLCLKLKGGNSYGKGTVQEGLKPVHETIPDIDARTLDSPVCFENGDPGIAKFYGAVTSSRSRVHKSSVILFLKKNMDGFHLHDKRIGTSDEGSLFPSRRSQCKCPEPDVRARRAIGCLLKNFAHTLWRGYPVSRIFRLSVQSVLKQIFNGLIFFE